MWEMLRGFDTYLINLVQSFIGDRMTFIMEFFSLIGSYKGYLFICTILLILLFRNKKIIKDLYFVFFGLTSSAILNELLKQLFHRERPNGIRLVSESGLSFPSGHAMNSFVFYILFAVIVVEYFRKIDKKHLNPIHSILQYLFGFVCTLIILSIGISRVYLGVHYPTDVIGGYLFGAVWVTAILVSRKKILTRNIT